MAALQLEDKSIWDDADVSLGVVLRGTVRYKSRLVLSFRI